MRVIHTDVHPPYYPHERCVQCGGKSRTLYCEGCLPSERQPEMSILPKDDRRWVSRSRAIRRGI